MKTKPLILKKMIACSIILNFYWISCTNHVIPKSTYESLISASITDNTLLLSDMKIADTTFMHIWNQDPNHLFITFTVTSNTIQLHPYIKTKPLTKLPNPNPVSSPTNIPASYELRTLKIKKGSIQKYIRRNNLQINPENYDIIFEADTLTDKNGKYITIMLFARDKIMMT